MALLACYKIFSSAVSFVAPNQPACASLGRSASAYLRVLRLARLLQTRLHQQQTVSHSIRTTTITIAMYAIVRVAKHFSLLSYDATAHKHAHSLITITSIIITANTDTITINQSESQHTNQIKPN